MADSELNIILRLSDEATKNLEVFRENVEKVGNQIKHTGQQLSRFGTNMAFIGAAITGPLAVAFKTASEYSTEANKALNNLNNASINLQATIGTALAPVINSIAGAIQRLTNWFNSLDEIIRNNIIQLTLIGGILLTIGGAAISLAGKVIQLAGAFMAFAIVNLPLLVIIGSIILIIKYWEQVRVVVIPILNALEIGFLALDIGILKIVNGIMILVQNIISTLQPAVLAVADAMYQLYLVSDEQISGIHNAFANLGAGIQKQRTEIAGAIQQLQDDITNIMAKGEGVWASWADQGVGEINNLIKKFQEFVKEVQFGINVKIPTATKVMDNSLKGISTIFSAIGSAAGQALSATAAYFEQAQGETSKYATLIKAVRIGETIINTATGVMRAFADFPWPFSGVVAGLVAATGAMQLATISAQKMALGGEGVVNKPTLFLAGEAGPERFAFTPLGKDRESGPGPGGTFISVNMENVSFRSEDDIEDVMTRLSDLVTLKTRSKI